MKETIILKRILIIFFIISSVMIFIPDINMDEVAFYYRFSMNDIFSGDFSLLKDVFVRSDHFPLYFLLHGLIYHITKNIIILRAISVLYSLVTIFCLFNIGKYHLDIKKSAIWVILTVSSAQFIYITVFSSKYNLALMFLSLFWYFLVQKQKEDGAVHNILIFGVLSLLSHYFLYPVVGLLIFWYMKGKIRNKSLIIWVILGIIIFAYFSIVFGNMDDIQGEGNYISINSPHNPELSMNILLPVRMLGALFIYPGLYVPGTVISVYSLIVGSLLLIMLIFSVIIDKRYYFLLIFLSQWAGIAVLSMFLEKRYHLSIYEADRLVFLLPFFYFILCSAIRKYKAMILLVFLIINVWGVFNFYNLNPDDLENIGRVCKAYNDISVYSDAFEYKGRFDSAVLLEIQEKIKFSEYPPVKDEFLLFTDYELSGEFPNASEWVRDKIRNKRFTHIYDGHIYELYLISPLTSR